MLVVCRVHLASFLAVWEVAVSGKASGSEGLPRVWVLWSLKRNGFDRSSINHQQQTVREKKPHVTGPLPLNEHLGPLCRELTEGRGSGSAEVPECLAGCCR